MYAGCRNHLVFIKYVMNTRTNKKSGPCGLAFLLNQVVGMRLCSHRRRGGSDGSRRARA